MRRILRRNGSGVLTFVEPPRADPHAGWCGSSELALVGQLPATRFCKFIFVVYKIDNDDNAKDCSNWYTEKPEY